MSTTQNLQSICIDTAQLPIKDQFSSWRDGIAETLGLQVERDEPVDSAFRVRNCHCGTESVVWNRVEAFSPCTIELPHNHAGGYLNHLVGLQYRVGGNDLAGCFGACDSPSRAGDVRFFDYQQPWWYQTPGYRIYSLYLRRSWLLEHVSSFRKLHGAIFDESPLTRLFKRSLVNSFNDMDSATVAEAAAILRCIQTIAADMIKFHHIKDLESQEVGNASILQLITDFVERNYHDHTLSPEKIARAVGVSRTKLYRICGHFGTPMDLVRGVRLRKAAQALRTQRDIDIGILSYKVGFSVRQSFTRAFKAYYDLSPTEYRNDGPCVATCCPDRLDNASQSWDSYKNMVTLLD